MLHPIGVVGSICIMCCIYGVLYGDSSVLCPRCGYVCVFVYLPACLLAIPLVRLVVNSFRSALLCYGPVCVLFGFLYFLVTPPSLASCCTGK